MEGFEEKFDDAASDVMGLEEESEEGSEKEFGEESWPPAEGWPIDVVSKEREKPSKEEEDDDVWPPEATVRLVPRRRVKCATCGGKLTEGPTYCGDCGSPDVDADAEQIRQEHDRRAASYAIENGCVYSGMPNLAEPEMLVTEMPIWREHPDPRLYRNWPFTYFREQLEVAGIVCEPTTYRCFICGKDHDVKVTHSFDKTGHCWKCGAPDARSSTTTHNEPPPKKIKTDDHTRP